MSNENSSPAEQKAALRCYPIDQWYEFALPTKAPIGSPGPMRDVYEAVVQMVFEAWQACYEPLADRDAFIETMVIPLGYSTGVAIGKIHYYEASLNVLSPTFLELVNKARDQASRVLSVCERIRDEKDVDLTIMERMAAARPFDPYALIPPLRKALTDYIARTANPGAFPMVPDTIDEIADAIASRGKAVVEVVKPEGQTLSHNEVAVLRAVEAIGVLATNERIERRLGESLPGDKRPENLSLGTIRSTRKALIDKGLLIARSKKSGVELTAKGKSAIAKPAVF